MLTVLALAMIVLFIVLLSAKKLSVFASLTLVPLVFGLIAILFSILYFDIMLGSAIALVVNYRDVKLCSDRLEDLAPDVLPTAIITMGAGVFSGVLSGSGMANALANTIASLIPTSLSTHMAPVYAVIAAPAICFLPQDAFYFGIASVLKDVMGQFGITPLQSAVASMAGQSFRLVSPLIPALYMLCGETKMNFVDFQKEYTINFGWVVLIVYLVVFGLTGMLPY